MQDRGHRSCATPEGLAKAGSEPTIAAVERREASIPRHGMQGASQRLRATITGPPTGAAAPERLSALRFPHVVMRENWQTSEGLMPRENDEACAERNAVGWAKARVTDTGPIHVHRSSAVPTRILPWTQRRRGHARLRYRGGFALPTLRSLALRKSLRARKYPGLSY